MDATPFTLGSVPCVVGTPICPATCNPHPNIPNKLVIAKQACPPTERMPVMHRLFRIVPVVLACSVLALAGSGCHNGSEPVNRHAGATLMLRPENATGGVGVVRRTDLLVAFHRTSEKEAELRVLIRARDDARAAGDEQAVAAYEAYGEMMQDIAHRQLAGTEPLYTLIPGIEDELRLVMDRHALARVVEAGPGIAGLDVTDELTALLLERE